LRVFVYVEGMNCRLTSLEIALVFVKLFSSCCSGVLYSLNFHCNTTPNVTTSVPICTRLHQGEHLISCSSNCCRDHNGLKLGKAAEAKLKLKGVIPMEMKLCDGISHKASSSHLEV
jgi:hypothetical protein